MAYKKITLNSSTNNVSLQVGDTAYYTTPTINSSGFPSYNPPSIGSDPIAIGEIREIGSNYIIVEYIEDEFVVGDFILFSKNKIVNNTSLLGYYAEVKLSNDSTEKAELFALSSEITPSSK